MMLKRRGHPYLDKKISKFERLPNKATSQEISLLRFFLVARSNQLWTVSSAGVTVFGSMCVLEGARMKGFMNWETWEIKHELSFCTMNQYLPPSSILLSIRKSGDQKNDCIPVYSGPRDVIQFSPPGEIECT